jgi:hypothetical protein
MLCPNGTVKPFLVSLVEPVAYLKSELCPTQISSASSTSVGGVRRCHRRDGLPRRPSFGRHQGVIHFAGVRGFGEAQELVFLDFARRFRHRHSGLCSGDILVRASDFHELIDCEKRRDRLNHGKVERGLILVNYVRGHTAFHAERTRSRKHFARFRAEVKVLNLRADVRKVKGLHAQPVLPRGFHLEFPEPHEWIARSSRHLLCVIQRDAARTRRSIKRARTRGRINGKAEGVV